MFRKNLSRLAPAGLALLLSLPLVAYAADPTSKEATAPSSVVKMTPTGSVSLRYRLLDYGVSGGKLALHEFKKGTGPDEIHFIDIITPNGKRIQRFQLAYAPEAVSAAYTIRPLWLIPSRKKLASLLFEGVDAHLMIVFAGGFGKPGSQQFFSEKADGQRRELGFNELDRRGYRMVRVDTDEPAVGDKAAFKATTYYFWDGTKFSEKPR
jgi:hypothetical protein